VEGSDTVDDLESLFVEGSEEEEVSGDELGGSEKYRDDEQDDPESLSLFPPSKLSLCPNKGERCKIGLESVVKTGAGMGLVGRGWSSDEEMELWLDCLDGGNRRGGRAGGDGFSEICEFSRKT